MTRRINVGTVPVGGGAPVSIQSMCNTKTDDVAATVAQILRLEEAGCEIIRVAVPDEAAGAACSAGSGSAGCSMMVRSTPRMTSWVTGFVWTVSCTMTRETSLPLR